MDEQNKTGPNSMFPIRDSLWIQGHPKAEIKWMGRNSIYSNQNNTEVAILISGKIVLS